MLSCVQQGNSPPSRWWTRYAWRDWPQVDLSRNRPRPSKKTSWNRISLAIEKLPQNRTLPLSTTWRMSSHTTTNHTMNHVQSSVLTNPVRHFVDMNAIRSRPNRGAVARVDYRYERNGKQRLQITTELLTGWVAVEESWFTILTILIVEAVCGLSTVIWWLSYTSISARQGNSSSDGSSPSGQTGSRSASGG